MVTMSHQQLFNITSLVTLTVARIRIISTIYPMEHIIDANSKRATLIYGDSDHSDTFHIIILYRNLSNFKGCFIY